MNAAGIIARRELSTNLKTPLAWTLLGLFSLLSGWIFFNLLVGYADGVQALPAEAATQVGFMEEVVLRLYGNLHFLLLFFVPPITMRLLAEERRQGTLDLLYAAPVSEASIVLGKFLGAWLTVLFLLLPTLLFPVVLFWAGIPERAVLATCYAGLAFNAACYVGLGLFASALTENPVVAALGGFALVMGTWLIGWAAQTVDNFWVSEALGHLSVNGHFEQLLRGVLATPDLVYYASFVALTLWASTKALESRNW